MEWLVKAETVVLLNNAQIEHNKMRRDLMLEKIEKAQKDLDALKAELATMP
jgi:hypothetical protein